MTENELRSKVCAQARSWLGRKEADGSHREIIDIYNRDKLPGTYVMTYQDPWCAAFVSAVGMACGLKDIILPHVNCEGMISAYRAQGRWVEQDDFVPQAGDIIFYDWDDSGSGDCVGTSDHVGIVTAVENYYMTIIEGNKSDSVSTRTLAIGSRYIRGFAAPDYASKTGETPHPADDEAGDFGEPSVIDRDTGLVPLPTLRRGSKSEAVRNAQRLLIARGYYCGGPLAYNGRESPDGEFGPETAKAVKLFQAASEIPADEEIGPVTWGKLITT